MFLDQDRECSRSIARHQDTVNPTATGMDQYTEWQHQGKMHHKSTSLLVCTVRWVNQWDRQTNLLARQTNLLARQVNLLARQVNPWDRVLMVLHTLCGGSMTLQKGIRY